MIHRVMMVWSWSLISAAMKTSRYGEVVLESQDIEDMILQGRDVSDIHHARVSGIDIQQLRDMFPDLSNIQTWQMAEDRDISVSEFDQEHQNRWLMPREYQELDIAQVVLDLCATPEELQRAAQELLMFQDRDMMPVLQYMKYLVDTMRANNIVWGVGRGSSVASFVLYLLGVHRINSLYYELDPGEFLR